MDYQRRLSEHLAGYRVARLGIETPGTFRHRDREIPYGHILPKDQADRNLLDLALPMIREYEASNPGLKRHRYFHHLNSSQAFALNLFFPYFEDSSNGAAALLRALGQPGLLTRWKPEYIPDPEERTNVDVMWETADGTRTICEVKLSEAGFGSAEADKEHLLKLEAIYRQPLRAHVSPDLLSPPNFFRFYQLLRNVWHLARPSADRLLFLMPRANTGLWRSLTGFLPQVSAEMRSRITTVAIEDVLISLECDSDCPEALRSYAGELSTKYVC